jgi:dTDP-glucose 4,6-dehydratase
MNSTTLVTGGAGFIGSALVRRLLAQGDKVIVLDALTYAGNLDNLAEVRSNPRLQFVAGNICDTALVADLFEDYQFGKIFHLAAESHVDNSIAGPAVFLKTNIEGTFTLLEAARKDWLRRDNPDYFRFMHISTDEVYGQLSDSDAPFTEASPYQPSSPYSASKAASDHLVRAWHHTYGLPTIVTNCTNNYGPRQHREKLIPTIIRKALADEAIPIYGNGRNIRDWIYVDDHVNGLCLAAEKGKPGDTYAFGGACEIRNIDIAHQICSLLDELQPRSDGQSYANQISFVTDRAGHDWRYAIDFSHAGNVLGYSPSCSFSQGIRSCIGYYLNRQTQENMATA